MARLVTVVLGLSLIAAGAAVGAERPASGEGRHLFLVPTAGKPAAALEKTNARVIARYEAFDLVEAAGGDAQRLQSSGADRRDDMRDVRIGRRSLDPARERGPLGPKRSRRSAGLAVVQFVGPVKDAWLARLRATSVRVVTYMAENGYLVRGSAKELERLAALPGADPAVRAVVPFTAEDKLGAGVKSGGRQRLAVQTLSGGDGAAPRGDVARAGRKLRDPSAVGPFRTQFVVLDAAAAARIARDPGVVSVQPAPAPKLDDEIADQIVAGNLSGANPLVPTGPGYFAFHESLGLGTATFPFAVDVTDEGIDAGTTATAHPDFHQDGAGANPTRLQYVDNFTTDTDAKDCGGHGTINSGIIGGYNTGTGSSGAGAVEDALGFNYGLGVAPRTKLGGSKIFKCAGAFSLVSNYTALTSNAYAKGARISSNSWGAPVNGAYTADAQEYDRLVRDAQPGTAGNQEMVEVFSAGNDGPDGGTIGTPGTAKNVLTVGAAENVRASGTDGCGVTNSGADDAHDIIDFSSRGPTTDGRIKPEIVGPGTHVTGTAPQHAGYTGGGVCNQHFPSGSALYSLSSGTSHSTPVLAGIAALVREWYRQKKGGGTAVPSPALTKAMIVGAGSDLVGGDDGASGTNTDVPDQTQGWGLANIRRTLDTGPRYFRDQQDVLGASGESFTRTFAVQDTGKPVRVTLAWTDAPGPTTGNSFVNDLNLTVAAGSTFKGNVFSGGQSAPGGTADSRNNVESVYLPAGTSGNFAVDVTAANIAGDGVPGNADTTDQDFALTLSNAAEVTAPALSDQSSTVTPQGDGDGALEPGEDFTVSEQLQNLGSAGATGISGTMSGPASVTVTDPTAAWPDLAPGESGANSDGLAATLGAGAACGAPVTMSLAITDTEGTGGTTVPIAVPTGGVGSPVARNSANVPRSIPDANPTGVTSTLQVAQAGIVKDLNVRIGSLTHTWVGDLVIDLTAPDGTTTVNLVNRPGGTENSGDNFTNTVFDDEAVASIGANAPYTGSFMPQSDQLSRFDGLQQQGTWTLRVADVVASDTGTLNSWGTDVSPADCDGVAPPPPPGAISGLNATPGPGSVALDWDDTPTATEYQVFRKTANATYAATPTALSSASAYSDPGRTDGAQYCYKVRAVNAGDSGPLSGQVCATATGTGTGSGATGGGGTGDGEPVLPVLPILDLGGMPSAIRLDSKGRFTLSFRGTALEAGSLKATTLRAIALKPKSKKRRRVLVRRKFTTPANGRVRLRLKLSRRYLRVLKRTKRLRVRVAVRLGSRSTSRVVTLRAPKKRRTRTRTP